MLMIYLFLKQSIIVRKENVIRRMQRTFYFSKLNLLTSISGGVKRKWDLFYWFELNPLSSRCVWIMSCNDELKQKIVNDLPKNQKNIYRWWHKMLHFYADWWPHFCNPHFLQCLKKIMNDFLISFIFHSNANQSNRNSSIRMKFA